jgi:hypothetical protein
MTTQPAVKSYSAFLPVVLIALGIISLFSWNLIISLQQHSSGLRISIQQELQLTQATQTEVKLKAMMSDLIELSKQDKDAQKIVTRYKIAINK